MFCVKFTLHTGKEGMELQFSKKCKESRTAVREVNTVADK